MDPGIVHRIARAPARPSASQSAAAEGAYCLLIVIEQ
jgi:hypothetical protein